MRQEEKRLIQNKYEIVSKIKQGGFGIVYKGYDHVFEKPVAIKAIEPKLLKEAKYVDLFLEEAKNAGKLSHNNIVHIYNLVRDENGQFFIIMEYVDGVDLGKILRVCKKKNVLMPQELSIFIIKEICKALEYAHNKRDLMTDKPLRLVHQDISPSNIMTSLSGHVKLIDFGLAKIRFQSDNSNEVVLSGKLPYMAPEQVNGGVIDRRTDIFSLGTVFYEMLTGSRLFPLEDPNQTIELIKKTKVDASLLDKNNIPQSVQQILFKMLQRNPENRYHGANGVYLDLVECLMTMAHSVELSNELGKFIQQLFDFDEKNNNQSTQILTVDKATDEGIIESYFEDLPEFREENEISSSPSNSQQFDIKETEINTDNLPEELQASLSDLLDKTEQDDKIEAPEISDWQIENSSETTTELEDGTVVIHTKSILEDDTETDENLSEIYIDSDDESPQEDEQNTTLIDNQSGDIFSNSTTELEVDFASEPVKEISNEINEILGSEIELTNFDQSVDSRLTSTNEDVANQKTIQTVPSIYTEEEGEDDLKTVIDVIRLSTKRHKRIFTIAGGSVLGVILLFFIFDIMFQITSLGERIYNRLFPPAIRISSLPAGATVYIDNKPTSGKTPLSIPKITPGVHELKLNCPGFNPLIKSIHVPSKGEVKVAGEQVRKGYDPYLFRFKSQIDIQSDPSGATVYINQLLYPNKTPTTLEWEVGNPLSIELEQEGFQKLSGFVLNTLDGIEEIEDRRLWSFNTIEGESKKYLIEGIFKKFITISCIPSGVNFYIDGSPTPSGRTDISSTIALTMGKHEILFQKEGLNSKRVTVNVDKNGPESISVMLTRNVRFFAKDRNDLGNNEIGATIVKIIQNNRSYSRKDRTPCEIDLPPINLQVVLSKDGYKDAIVNVSPRDKDVVIKMEPSILDVEIIVLDALTGLPLRDAQISYRSLTNEQAAEVYYGSTDEKGICRNKINPGEYSFKVKKFGYFEKYSILNTKTGATKLEFKLIIQ